VRRLPPVAPLHPDAEGYRAAGAPSRRPSCASRREPPGPEAGVPAAVPLPPLLPSPRRRWRGRPTPAAHHFGRAARRRRLPGALAAPLLPPLLCRWSGWAHRPARRRRWTVSRDRLLETPTGASGCSRHCGAPPVRKAARRPSGCRRTAHRGAGPWPPARRRPAAVEVHGQLRG